MKSSPLLLGLLLLQALPLNLSAAEKLLLRPHWEIGKIYRQENITDLTMSIPGMGDAGGQKTNMVQTMSVTVTKDAASDNKHAEVKFTAIKGVVGMMGQNMTFDSSDPAKSSPFLQQTFGALVGKTFTLVYDKEDKFLDVKGLENVAPTPLGQGQAMDGKQLADSFRKSQDLALPKDPVEVGGTWAYEDKLEMPPMGSMTIKATGKFDSIVTKDGARQAKLLLEGTFATPAADPGAGAAAQMMQFGEGSKFTGEVYFDLDRKVVTSSEVKSELKLSVAGKEAPLTQTTITKLVGVEAAK
jgi:hypothetical protein